MSAGPPDQDHILIIKLGALGDFLQALGPIAAIRRAHKGAHISLLTTQPYANFAMKIPYINAVLVDLRPGWKDPRGWLELRRTLIAGRFSRVYDLQNNTRSNLYYKLFPLSRRPEWVGTARGASHHNASPERTAGHAFDGHIQTLGKAGVTGIALDTLDWINSDLSGFGLRNPYALIVPGSAPDRPEKRWPAEKYAGLCKALVLKGLQPVIIGSAQDTPLASEIQQAGGLALDLTGKTELYDLPVLARGAQLAVGNDTGPMHWIAATGCPSLVLFSRHSNPARHAPLGGRVETLQTPALEDLDESAVLEVMEKILKPAPVT